MAAPLQMRSERLLLRRWRPSDRLPFRTINADPVVMEFYPSTLTADQSDRFVERIEETFDDQQLGLWAVELPDVAPFIGYVGLWPTTFSSAFIPAVEVGWRLARSHWGHGYATEAARMALADGFDRLALSEIVSFTAAINQRSTRVMEKLGMCRDPDGDFDHPAIPKGHPLRAHVLYRLPAPTQDRSDRAGDDHC